MGLSSASSSLLDPTPWKGYLDFRPSARCFVGTPACGLPTTPITHTWSSCTPPVKPLLIHWVSLGPSLILPFGCQLFAAPQVPVLVRLPCYSPGQQEICFQWESGPGCPRFRSQAFSKLQLYPFRSRGPALILLSGAEALLLSCSHCSLP